MSASGKLKALDEAMVPPEWPLSLRKTVGDKQTTFHIEDADTMALLVLRNALPKLVAMVEAAELFNEDNGSAWPEVRDALAALEEALS